MNNLKEKIIYHVFEFIDTGDVNHSELAKGFLEIFAKEKRINIRLVLKINTKDAFKKFILNESGYIETIPKLFYSL